METADSVCRDAAAVKGDDMRKKRRKIPAFWIGLGIYTVILLILCLWFLRYTDKSLIQYENAQPEAAAESYLAEFEKMAADGTLFENIDMPQAASAFETEDIYRELYQARLKNINSYTVEKDADSYLAEEPAYYICGDGEPVARVVFSASNERTIFAILTIMDWKPETVTPVMETEQKSYTIQVPDTCRAQVNGIPLTDNDLTGETYENPDYVNVSLYVKMPVLVEYRVTDLIREPEVRVFAENGAEVLVARDEDGNFFAAGNDAGEMPQERYAEALKMAQTWENFLTRDLGGESHGIKTVQKYLIKDSYYWDIANAYVKSPDITFISSHSLSADPYSNIEISDYIPYGENCYSCHIYFEKHMTLTRTGAHSVDTINSTFYFVNYDDSDDGIDNPHWAIADMIAATDD